MLCSCPCRPRCTCGECFVTRSVDDDDSLACYHAGAIVTAPAGSGICRTGYTRIVREVALPSGAGCTFSPCNNGRICERLTDKLHALAATIQPPVPARAWRLFFLIVHAPLRVKVSFRMSQIISAECHPWDVAACPQYSGQNCSGLLSFSIAPGARLYSRSQREPRVRALLAARAIRVRAVLAARAIVDRDVKIEHARIAHSERLCGRRRPRTHNHPCHKCRSAKGRRIISL